MFRWAVSQGIVPGSVHYELTCVDNLKRGRYGLSDPPRRKPVAWEDVAPVLTYLRPDVRAMVLVQWYTGCRAASVCCAMADQIETCMPLWRWHPVHKTSGLEICGTEVDLVIPVGPRCQEVLLPYMSRRGYLFSPRGSVSHGRYRERYDANSYQQSLSRAQSKAGVAHWTTHQLRHSKGQSVRLRYGIEAQQAVLGHRTLKAAEVYSSRQECLAEMVAREEG
jgi:integrase